MHKGDLSVSVSLSETRPSDTLSVVTEQYSDLALSHAQAGTEVSAAQPLRMPLALIGQTLTRLLTSYRRRRGTVEPLAHCLELIGGRGPSVVQLLVDSLPHAWSDHAIASIYAVLMPRDRRKQLGAYFTPPHLVDHLVWRLQACGMDLGRDRLRDPAAGGAAFLVPLARLMISEWRSAGATDLEILTRLPIRLLGSEIEPKLAIIANALLHRMLVKEFGIDAEKAAGIGLVQTDDSLAEGRTNGDVDHEIGNPPFLRLSRLDHAQARPRFADISSGRLNLYAMFVRRALEAVPVGGLVGYILPASFLGGPEFSLFRRRVLQLAEVLAIDMVEKRSDVFLDAIQDACFLILRRRRAPIDVAPPTLARSGILQRDGRFEVFGLVELGASGAPWRLPGESCKGEATLTDWGYRGSIGYLVANRQAERLHVEAGEGRFPLIWAKAVTTEGSFDFARGAAFKDRGWVAAPPDAPYVVRQACVAVQRTSSRGQNRRLNAAAIPEDFVHTHGGIVGENHVILLVPTRTDAPPPEELARALNEQAASEELDRICGSASISVRLLESMRLRKPPT
ncbi:N-6 DNA methylase [Rhizobium leguminosarum]|uniref:Eco57I restriction-modification methylase domain-containing protein n=1 Tax=Rhizobium leguminosarum TaxID=384 RepID=UPI0013B648D5|nr:N-6 DNA methylase [Rhizobium leguminosarum]